MSPEPLCATLLTPRGRGAVAVVRAWGPDATAVVARMFAPAAGGSLEKFAPERIVFGRWHGAASPTSNDTDSGEELVVCRRAADDIEIHCHGGAAASTAILAALEAAGCAIVPWSDWSAERSVDRIQSEANEALAEARTARTAGILLDQHAGALSRAVDAIVASLKDDQIADARRLLDDLTARSAIGRHLVAPFQVVLAGRPNVGKSSLINALVGYERSIVFDRPGTTRDVVTASTVFDGWPIELSDTAGLRDSADLLERAGMNAARRRLADADLIVLVFDATESWNSNDDALRTENPDALVVHNKIDRVLGKISDRPTGLELSATTGRGVEDLIRAITLRLVPQSPQSGEAVPFTERQCLLLAEATAAFAQGDLATVSSTLGLISTGTS